MYCACLCLSALDAFDSCIHRVTTVSPRCNAGVQYTAGGRAIHSTCNIQYTYAGRFTQIYTYAGRFAVIRASIYTTDARFRIGLRGKPRRVDQFVFRLLHVFLACLFVLSSMAISQKHLEKRLTQHCSFLLIYSSFARSLFLHAETPPP